MAPWRGMSREEAQGVIKAVLDGQTDPVLLASYRDCRCKKDEKLIAKYLTGDFRKEHLFVLKQAYKSWSYTRLQMQECDQEIKKQFGALPRHTTQNLPNKKRSKPKQNEVQFDLANYLYQILGVDLTQVYGIDSLTTLTIDQIDLRREAYKSIWSMLVMPRISPDGKPMCSTVNGCKNSIPLGYSLPRFDRPTKFVYYAA